MVEEDKKVKDTEKPQTDEEKALVKSMEEKPPDLVVGREISGGLVPRNIGELWRLSEMFFQSGMMPSSFRTPQAVAVAIQMGLEVGLQPMQACQNIAVINGRPTIWGDAALALVYGSGKLEEFNETMEGTPISDEWTATCVARRRGFPKPFVGTFTYKEAKMAGLVDKKESIWKKYPRRMLQMRARGFALRDGFADVLKGVYIREEVLDLEPDAAGTYVAKRTDENLKKLKDRIEAANTPEALAKEFETLTSIPLATFNGLQTKGIKQFIRNHNDKIVNKEWPEHILAIVRKKLDKPEWKKLLHYPPAETATEETPETEPEVDPVKAALTALGNYADWENLGLVECPRLDGNNTPATKCQFDSDGKPKPCDMKIDAEGVICPGLASKLVPPTKEEEVLS